MAADLSPPQTEKNGAARASRVPRTRPANLIVLVRNLSQLEAALKRRDDGLLRVRRPKKISRSSNAVSYGHGCAARNREFETGNFCRSAAHFQIGRGMDTQAGPLLQCRRLSRPQLRSLEIFCRHAARRGFFTERGEPHCGGLFQKPIRSGTRDRQLRFERHATGGVITIHAAGMV